MIYASDPEEFFTIFEQMKKYSLNPNIIDEIKSKIVEPPAEPEPAPEGDRAPPVAGGATGGGRRKSRRKSKRKKSKRKKLKRKKSKRKKLKRKKSKRKRYKKY